MKPKTTIFGRLRQSVAEVSLFKARGVNWKAERPWWVYYSGFYLPTNTMGKTNEKGNFNLLRGKRNAGCAPRRWENRGVFYRALGCSKNVWKYLQGKSQVGRPWDWSRVYRPWDG